MKKNNQYTYITMINTDSYLNGALCLFESLRKVNSKYPFSILITSDVSEKSELILKSYGVNVIRTDEKVNVPQYILDKNIKLNMPHWNNSFDKLLIFEMVQFDKLIFLDSDMYITENIDHLFEKEHMSGVILGESFPEDYYSDWTRTHLSSGLMVIIPKKGLLLKLTEKFINLEGMNEAIGDQQIIWEYYDTWPSKQYLHLPEKYTVCYEHLDFYLKNQGYTLYKDTAPHNIATIHFANPKPWLIKPNIRIKYVLYQLVKLNFSVAKLLYDYFSVLRKIEKNSRYFT